MPIDILASPSHAEDVDPIKAVFAVFIAGLVAAFFIYFFNTQIAPAFVRGLRVMPSTGATVAVQTTGGQGAGLQ